MIEKIEQLALEAGSLILSVYNSKSFDIKIKSDQSPVTEADLLAHECIIAGLQKIMDLPYISEEEPPKTFAQAPSKYWLIDPLDGTKEFIARRDTFTVNIALIENSVPVAGVVYAPALNELYSACYGVYRENGNPVESRPWPEGRILLSSHSHPESGLAAFIANNKITANKPLGSSLKFCWIAARKAHVYPRFSSLSAWDTAAGDAVARAAGCKVIDWETGQAPKYEFTRSRTPAFCVMDPKFEAVFDSLIKACPDGNDRRQWAKILRIEVRLDRLASRSRDNVAKVAGI